MDLSKDDLYRQQIQVALAHLAEGDFERALEASMAAMRTNPAGAEAVFVLGLTATKLNDVGRAVSLIEEAHEFDPDCREYADALAAIMPKIGRLNDSLYYAKLATAAKPHPWLAGMVPGEFSDYFTALHSVAPSQYHMMAFQEYSQGEFARAVDLADRGLRANPRDIESFRVLGRALLELDDVDRALSALQAAAHIEPSTTTDLLYLGDALMRLGRFDEARTLYARMVAMDSGSAEIRSRMISRLTYFPRPIWLTIAEEQAIWNRAFGAPEDPSPSPDASRFRPDRPIRIGYIARLHKTVPDVHFIEAALRHFNTRKFEVYCYQQVSADDPLTTGLRANVDDWRDIAEIDDETVAAIVNGDDIDILVDAIGHGEGNRLSVFAYRPAPVQVSWLGLPNGGGVAGVDYILSDAATIDADRATAGDSICIDIEGSLVSFAATEALADWPAPSDPPARRFGHVTFGGICDLRRLTPDTVALWSDVLKSVDGSLLTLGRVRTITDAVRELVLSMFATYGAADRIQFQDIYPNRNIACEFLNAIDVVLDTQPVSGATEVCEALWMGVPVVTLKGDRRSGVMGASILAAAGKSEWVADSKNDFIQIAKGLGSNLPALEKTRQGLRDHVSRSRLCNGQGFVLSLEATFEKMWAEAAKKFA